MINYMQIDIPNPDAAALTRLAKDADLSRSRWVRAAIRSADADPQLADRIAAAAPEVAHGGYRPGAGRPKRPEGSTAADPETDGA
ncbi:hypothetical protein [Microbacterium sp.]|uniref:hypothetical protein n=1 Tax=Microbacterium sp. TaxID=51671 RepID=UPI003341D7AA